MIAKTYTCSLLSAQEFNQRKKRKGAFWEDRYHATALETNHHLV